MGDCHHRQPKRDFGNPLAGNGGRPDAPRGVLRLERSEKGSAPPTAGVEGEDCRARAWPHTTTSRHPGARGDAEHVDHQPRILGPEARIFLRGLHIPVGIDAGEPATVVALHQLAIGELNGPAAVRVIHRDHDIPVADEILDDRAVGEARVPKAVGEQDHWEAVASRDDRRIRAGMGADRAVEARLQVEFGGVDLSESAGG